jgi:uncharacterized protein (DUF885 family)
MFSKFRKLLSRLEEPKNLEKPVQAQNTNKELQTENAQFSTPNSRCHQVNVTNGFESLFLHEAIPGHHYQVSLQQENTEIPKFMRFGWFGAYGEGWAHYTETLGPEFGLYTDPYQKMGYLSDQMLRAVRLVVDTGNSHRKND